MLLGSMTRGLFVIALMALPAAAELTTYNSSVGAINWYDPLTNFTVIPFDGMTPATCSGSGGCSSLGGMPAGLMIYGFQGSPSSTNSNLLIVPENDPAQTYYNFGGTGPTGAAATNPRLLRSDSAVSNASQIGFRIVLPAPVTAFGFQVMSYSPSKTVSLSVNGTPVTVALGSYPTGTLTTSGIPSRSFFGITSPTTFQTVDIISAPGSGNTILIDNIAYGTLSNPSDVTEPQTAVFLFTGLVMMLLARRMKNLRTNSAATS